MRAYYRLAANNRDCFNDLNETRSSPCRSVAPTRGLGLHDLVLPTNKAPILRRRSDSSETELVEARWSLVSRKSTRGVKDLPKTDTSNVRAETIANSGIFKDAFTERRCLVPARAWYEWTGQPSWVTTWELTPKGGGTIFFAGIWEQFDDPEAGPTDTFAVITEPSGVPLNAFNHRAPVVVWGSDRNLWLDPTTSDSELQEMLGPESPNGFDARHIGGPSPETTEGKKGRRGRKPSFPSCIDRASRSAAQLLAKALELEAIGRIKEAACYRRDVEKIVAMAAQR